MARRIPTNNNSKAKPASLTPNQREPKEFAVNEEELRDLVFNATSRDMRGLRKLLMEKRDYDSECDYPKELTVNDHYKPYFDFHAVATRTVEVLPLETWQVQPSVFEDDDPNVKTEFEKAWDELGSNLRGQSWHKKEEGSPVWEYLKRADILSGIGSYGVILLGFDDGQPLNTPVAMLAEEDDPNEEETWDTSTEDIDSEEKPTTNALGSIDSQYNGSIFGPDKVPKLKEGTKRKLIFMRPFDETLVQVTRLETDVNSPRHNQPIMYRLTLMDPEFAKENSISMDISCPEVHWTRILHITDNLTNSECFGVPRQQPVYRHLRNLYKLYGGAPEMYWRGAMNGVSWETHPQLGGDVDVDEISFRASIENYRDGLQRDMISKGFTAKSIAPNISDPTPFIDGQITAICIKIGCPQRVFMGSERGELASTQDDSAWNDRLKHRQEMYVTPRIIIPFIDRMISTGVLPKPSGKIVEETLTEDNGTDQQPVDKTSQNDDSAQDPSFQEKSQGKPTTNLFRKPSSKPANAVGSPKGSFPPKSGGNASSDASTGDNVGTGPETTPTAPKTRKLPEKDTEPGYSIVWPDLDSMTEAQKATISLQKTQALMAFIAGNGESAMTLVDFYTKVLYMTDEEAIGVITAVNEQIENDERLTPDPEEARQDQLDQQADQFDKQNELDQQSIDKGQQFQSVMFDKKTQADQQMAQLNPKGKPPVTNLSALDKAKLLVNYNPSQKRDNHGRWSGGGAVKTTSKGEELHAVTKVNAEGNPIQQIGKKWEKGTWVGENKTSAPDHIQNLAIPPGWKNVHVNPDPNGTMLARGTDEKGRSVYKYSANDQAKNAAAKFGRVSELRQKRTEIFSELAKDSKNPEHKENADCLKVIMQTGIRPGSTKDTGADHASFGATTLQGKHVKVAEDGSVSLKFATGKNKGREVEFPIGDTNTASMLVNRAMASGAEGNLFKTDSSSLRDYSKGKDGGGFKTKDHRTALGTETAIREIQKRPVPKNTTEYKTATKEVATVVAKTLGNTPAIALKSYIDPTVFGSWKPTTVTE